MASPLLSIQSAGVTDAMGEDFELVQAAVSGSDSAFNQLVTKYRGMVYAVAYRFTRNHEEADDLAQETFIKAYENLKGFRREASLKTWLLRITTNLSINVKKSSRVAKDSGSEPTEFHSTEEHGGLSNLIESDRARELRRAISQLPARQREALVLKTYRDLTCDQVAEIMQCSVGTVKANVFNAMKKLKASLGDER